MNQRHLRPAHAFLLAVPAVVLAALFALLPASAGAATKPATAQKLYPSVAKVAPLKAGIGDRMTISGKGFRKGKNRNTVVFKRDGKRAIFVRATGTTTKRISFVIPSKLLPALAQRKGAAIPTRFRVRVLAARFGKRYTSAKNSPRIGPTPVNVKVSKNDCDGDNVLNADDKDDDNDLLPDTEETSLKTDACLRDSDGDGMSDGWEHHSALDRNSKAKPAPTRKPFPNALDKTDAEVDHDGDGLTNLEEYVAWTTTSGVLRAADADVYTSRLSYSGGNPNSDGRPRRADAVAYMDRDGNGFLSDFERDADGDLIPNMDEQRGANDAMRGSEGQSGDDPRFYDFGLFGPLYVEKVAQAQSVQDQPKCAGINQVPFYCVDSVAKVSKVDPLDWVEADTDGDGIRDDQDDVDHDDVANITEYLAELGAAPADRNFRHLDACIPNSDSRYCLVGTVDVDGDGIANRDDTDDDGDGMADTLESQVKTDPLVADTDGDGADDAFEYHSALDLNSAALPYPGKRPYPNALFADSGEDYDGDGLTAKEENRAWTLTGRGLPLQTYSDGLQCTGPVVPAPADPELARRVDMDADGVLCDDEKDVDGDGLTNWDEVRGRMTPEWWVAAFANTTPKESKYPTREYLATNFVDRDTDGDGLPDGADDEDGDGLTNSFETARPFNWQATYVSIAHAGTNPLARVNPFNPCKPFYSERCHQHPPFGYYPDDEDWEAPPYGGALPPY